MFHFQSIILSETCCGKNIEAAENGHICQLWTFCKALSRATPEIHAQHTKLLQ
jgi:hypothetical protein